MDLLQLISLSPPLVFVLLYFPSLSVFPYPLEMGVFSSSSGAVISCWGANKHNPATCGLHMNHIKSWYLIMFLLASKSPSCCLLLTTCPLLRLCSRTFLRVFFKTGVIDIESQIKHRQLCLTETMKGAEEGGEGEKREAGTLASALKGIKPFWTQVDQVYSKSVAVFNCRAVVFVF